MTRAALILTLLLVAGGAAADDISAELRLDPSVTTTPIPVGFTLVFANSGSRSRELPSQAILIVTPADSEPFIARWRGYLIADLVVAGLAPGRIEPHGSSELEVLPTLFFDHPNWFADPRLYAVGKKSLQVILSNALERQPQDERLLLAEAPKLEDAVVSSKATLDVRAGNEEDGRLCAFVREEVELSEPCPLHAIGSKQELIGRTWSAFPGSTYRPFLAARVAEGDLPSKIARLEALLAEQADPARPWVESWNLFYLAGLCDIEAGQALSVRDRERARRFADKTVAAYRRLGRSPYPFFRKMAEERLTEFADFRKVHDID